MKASRRVEVFECHELRSLLSSGWKRVAFAKLKKGDIFRLFNINEDGSEEPDQVIRGHHAVQVALEDAKKMPLPAKGVVKCLLVRGFKGRGECQSALTARER